MLSFLLYVAVCYAVMVMGGLCIHMGMDRRMVHVRIAAPTGSMTDVSLYSTVWFARALRIIYKYPGRNICISKNSGSALDGRLIIFVSRVLSQINHESHSSSL